MNTVPLIDCSVLYRVCPSCKHYPLESECGECGSTGFVPTKISAKQVEILRQLRDKVTASRGLYELWELASQAQDKQ